MLCLNLVLITLFLSRTAHASCVFNGYIWVVGGRTVTYAMYNLVSSVKTADVWYSADGGISALNYQYVMSLPYDAISV